MTNVFFTLSAHEKINFRSHYATNEKQPTRRAKIAYNHYNILFTDEREVETQWSNAKHILNTRYTKKESFPHKF